MGQAVHIPQQDLDQRSQVMAPGGRLCRLAVCVGDHQCVAMTGCQRDQTIDQIDQSARQRDQPVAQSKVEERVVDIVATPAGVKTAGGGDAEAPAQRILDHTEQIFFHRADSDFVESGREIRFDGLERLEDGSGIASREQALFSQHHCVRIVDAEQIPPMVSLHALEERRQDCFSIGGCGERIVGRHEDNMLPECAFSQSAAGRPSRACVRRWTGRTPPARSYRPRAL